MISKALKTSTNIKSNLTVQTYNLTTKSYECSPVVAISEYARNDLVDFYKIKLETGEIVHLTDDHMIYAKRRNDEKPIAAEDLKQTDEIVTQKGYTKISSLEITKLIPISPQTTTSTIVVNGVLVSTLTKFDPPVETSQKLLYESHKFLSKNNFHGKEANIWFEQSLDKIKQVLVKFLFFV